MVHSFFSLTTYFFYGLFCSVFQPLPSILINSTKDRTFYGYGSSHFFYKISVLHGRYVDANILLHISLVPLLLRCIYFSAGSVVVDSSLEFDQSIALESIVYTGKTDEKPEDIIKKEHYRVHLFRFYNN